MSDHAGLQWDRALDAMLQRRSPESAAAPVVTDPYPAFARLRGSGTVHRMADLRPEESTGTLGHDVIVLGYDEVQAVLRDTDTYSSRMYATLDAVTGPTILAMDGAEHRTHRAFAQKVFTRQAMADWQERIIEPVITTAVERLRGRDRADLVEEVAFPLPFAIIAGMIGLPDDDLSQFHDWAIDLIAVGTDLARASRAADALRDYFRGLIAERRKSPRDDITSALVHARGPGRRLTDEEVLPFLLLLLPAGAETSYRSISNLCWALLDEPKWLDQVRADPALIPLAVDEALRWESPIVSVPRDATCDTVLAGVEIPKGATIAVSTGAANRDPRYWVDGERFDPTRASHPLLTFGYGAHLCLGMHLIRLEAVSVLTHLLAVAPNLRADPDRERPEITGLVFRAPASLPALL